MAHARLNTVLEHVRGMVAAETCSEATDGLLLERFAATHEEAAFAVLVRRHGPMVLGVGRRVLRQTQDMEDVFQATFLLLARKAGSIRKPESVSSWLHGVALRLAVKARAQRACRQGHERRVATMRPRGPGVEAAWQDLQGVLDEALDRLPKNQRAALVLCYFEGKTHEEAAHQLGSPLATLRSWLARGRKRLRQELTRRGVQLSAGAVVTALTANAAEAAVPAQLLHPTVKAGLEFAAGRAAAGVVAPPVARLVERGLKVLFLARMKLGIALVLSLSLFVIGAGVAARQALAAKPSERMPEAGPRPSAEQVSRTEPDGPKTGHTDRSGDRLPAEAMARLGTVCFRDVEGCTSLAYTPDGTLLLSSGYRGVRVWDAATGKQLRRLGGDLPSPHGGAALSRDGKLLAIGGWSPVKDTGGAVYDFATGRQRFRFGKASLSATPCFSPNGHILAAYRDDFTVDLYDTMTGRLLRSLKPPEATHTEIYVPAGTAFTPDGQALVAVGGNGTIRLWDVATGKERRRLAGGNDGVSAFALSPDGSHLASVAQTKLAQGGGQTTQFAGNVVRLWDVATGKEVRRLVIPTTRLFEGHPMGGNVFFTPDGKALLTAGADGTLRVWELATGQEVRRFTGPEVWLTALAFAPGGRSFAVAEGGKKICVCDLATGRELVPTDGHGQTVSSLSLSPDGRQVATSSEDRTIRLWDRTTGRELRRLTGQEDWVRAVTFSGDGRTLFSAGDDKTLRVWDTATGQQLRRLNAPWVGRVLLALSPDGRIVAAAGRDQTVLLLDATTGQELRTLKGPAQGTAGLGFSPDSRTLLAWGYDQHLHLWDTATGQDRQRPLAGPEGNVALVVFSADGRRMAFGSGDDFIPVVDVATGQEICRFANLPKRSNGAVSCLAFAPDGRTLAWGRYGDPRIRLGEVATGRVRHHLDGHRDHVAALAFSADGRLLVSGAGDTTALVWDLTGGLGTDKARSAPLSGDGLASCWEDLGSDDADRAYTALRRLLAEPGRSVPDLQRRLCPVATVEGAHLARLLGGLDSNSFTVRQQSKAALERLGDSARAALGAALAGRPSLEARRRLQALLAKLEEWTAPRLRALRAVEALEQINNDAARRRLEELARGATGAWLTQEAKGSLERLARRSGWDR